MDTYTLRLSLVTSATILVLSTACKAQDTTHLKLCDTLIEWGQLFENDLPLECSLRFNIKKFQKEKKNEKYEPAVLIIKNSQENITVKDVRVKARGCFRQKHCSMPPFWLNVQRIKNKVDSLDVNKKYKVVTHCNYGAEYEKYLLKEYLVYKIYNILTDYSFNVRLIKINYIDSGRKNKTTKKWGFILEPLPELTERHNSVHVKLNTLALNHTEEKITDLFCMYAFFMGNTDWSMAGRHNIKLLTSKEFNKPEVYPIPYDFDYTGFVNTDYALPADGSGLNHVRERLYVGPCRPLINYMSAAQHIINHKDEIYQLINGFEHLGNSSKDDLLSFMDEFFKMISRPDFIKYHIDIDCGTEDEGTLSKLASPNR